LWNPSGAPLREALALLHAPHRSIGVLGGTNVFALFLDRYDVFYLSCAEGVRLSGGRPIFPQVPARSPADILHAHGLSCDTVECAAANLTIETWRPNSSTLLEAHRNSMR
jgi:dihydrofolate reductase